LTNLSSRSILLFLWLLGILLKLEVSAQTFADTLGVTRGGIFSSNDVDVSIMLSDVDVYFTTDGTVPNSSSSKWTGDLKLSKTTVIRFKAYREGIAIGSTTQTYIIGRTFDMAVISIVVHPDDFFGFERGIYVKGCCAAETPPYQGANFWKKWERQINIEFYEPDGTMGFNQPAGVRIFGGFSKGWPMKSLAIIAREKYGPKRFKYQIFPNKEIKKFKSFVLRNSGGDFNKTHFRDAFMTDLVEPLDMEIQAYRPAVVFVNGEYWGIHNVREKITEHYLAANCGVDKDSVDLMRHRADVQFGSNKEYKKLVAFLDKNSFSENEMIRELDKWMDIDNYINYNIAEVYIDNRDAGGNIRYWRERKEGARWRWIFYDTDLSFGISDWKAYRVNTLHQMTTASTEVWPNPSWSTFIIRKLLENDSVKQVYSNRFADHLNTIFASNNVIAKIDSMQQLIKNEMAYHVQRWPSLSLKSWDKNVQVLRDFATYRPTAMRGFIMEKFGWDDTVYIGLGDFNAREGKVKLNSLVLDSSFYGWYFSGCPITIEALPKPGYEFDRWEGVEVSTAKVILDPNQLSQVFYPIFKKKVASKYYGIVFINELSCKQADEIEYGDWIELNNASDKDVDLSGWKIYNKDGDYFEWNDISLSRKTYLVMVKSPKKMTAVFPEIEHVIGSQKLKLKFGKKRDFLILEDAEGFLVDSLRYDLPMQFSEYPQFESIVLSKKNPLLPSSIKSWDMLDKGTPGVQNSNYEDLPSNDELSLMQLIQQYSFYLLISFSVVALLIIGLVFRSFRKRKSTKIQNNNNENKEEK
jgi:hypothetical protein